MNALNLHAVADAGLPDYPIGREVRMAGHFFTMWDHVRWLNSTMYRKATPESQCHFMNLCFMAQTQRPVGTLPADDGELAHMLRLHPDRWMELRRMEFGPLRHWERCLCDDEVRLFHPVVLEVALDALGRRQAREASNAEKAVTMRLVRMREQLAKLGVHKSVLADDVLIERMDQWLVDHHKGQRRTPAYQRVMEHAAAQGWFNPAR
ncbi:MAG: hypothetical protein KKB02_16020 [Alphaproteobacteria bacterium]|nr:hypothetical protein [Alphaproteobacteria bacterium]